MVKLKRDSNFRMGSICPTYIWLIFWNFLLYYNEYLVNKPLKSYSYGLSMVYLCKPKALDKNINGNRIVFQELIRVETGVGNGKEPTD